MRLGAGAVAEDALDLAQVVQGEATLRVDSQRRLEFSPARFAHSADRRDWAYRRIEATARAMLDGLAVWAREVIRPMGEQSPGIIEHEAMRAFRLADYFEGLLAKHRVAGDKASQLGGPLTMAQIFLFGSLDVERRLPTFNWRDGRPSLADWHTRVSELPSVRGSRPPSSP